MASNADNPYAATTVIDDAISPRSDEPSAQQVFLAWEKLRLLYNGLLAGIVLISGYRNLQDWTFWVFVVEGAVGANLCYCAGPVLEGYLALISIPRQKARVALFVLGCCAASGLTYLATAAWQNF